MERICIRNLNKQFFCLGKFRKARITAFLMSEDVFVAARPVKCLQLPLPESPMANKGNCIIQPFSLTKKRKLFYSNINGNRINSRKSGNVSVKIMSFKRIMRRVCQPDLIPDSEMTRVRTRLCNNPLKHQKRGKIVTRTK